MARRQTLVSTGQEWTLPAGTGQTFAAPRHASIARWTKVIAAGCVCLGVAAYGVLTAWLAPLSARIHYDPSLQYMLSSLSWFRGGTYSYIDHPGTPVEVLGTVVLALSYPFTASAPDGFVPYQLTHPQQFLSETQTVLVLASVVVCGLLACYSVVVTHWSEALVGTAVAASFFVVLPGAFESLALWSHESFCYPAGTLLCLAVLVVVRRATRPSWPVVLGLGLAAGVLSSVQLYFLAWVAGTAVALSVAVRLSGASWRATAWRAAMTAAAAGLGFIVATLPIHDHYRPLAGWILLLISHQGNYGGGPVGFSSPALLAGNLSALILAAPVLFLTSGASIAFLLVRLWMTRGRPAAHQGTWAAGVGLTVQLLVLLVLVGKHPGVRYLLPLAATVPIVFAAALDELGARTFQMRLVLAGLGLAILAGFGANLSASIAAHLRAADELRLDDARTESTLTTLAAERHASRSALRTLWTYATTSPCYALWFADDSADRLFRADIARLCPNDANLNIWNASITTPIGDRKLVDDQDWDVLVLPADLAQLLPEQPSPVSTFESSIASLGYGHLTFVTRSEPVGTDHP